MRTMFRLPPQGQVPLSPEMRGVRRPGTQPQPALPPTSVPELLGPSEARSLRLPDQAEGLARQAHETNRVPEEGC